MSDWSLNSWQQKPALQQPVYPDPAHLDQVLARLHNLPPLVTSWEIERLKTLLGDAATGRRFVLQGGDCAESFADCTPDAITVQLKILLQMSLVLMFGGKIPIVRIGRFAGQYAKPRSSPTETRDGVTLPSYFGDLVNHIEFTPEARTPNPQLLARGFQHAAMTLNFIRSLIGGGFADLHHPEYWSVEFCDDAALHEEYVQLVKSITESIDFMERVADAPIEELSRVDFFTSHEGLNLLYESGGTRTVPRRDGHYNLTTHLPWIGDRTRQLDSAHVEFFRGIHNPIAVKIGPTATPDELIGLTEVLNPHNTSGRLTFVHRFGAGQIAKCLPPLLERIRDAGCNVLWICDPMHGNARTTSSGAKTRDFANILTELELAFDLHNSEGTILGGVHFELTGEHVTECIGGASGLTEDDLTRDYRSQCDPRLNYEQSLEMAFRIARRLRATTCHTATGPADPVNTWNG